MYTNNSLSAFNSYVINAP